MGDRLFPGLGNGGYDVAHYGLTLDYVPETNRLKGTAVITARATQDLSRFDLDLSGLRVRTARVRGAEARIRRSADELLVTPAKALRKGETFETVVTYDGTPRTLGGDEGDEGDEGGLEGWIETDDGATALGEPTGSMTWFPGNHHPSDKATYDITVTVPKDADGDPYDVVSNGTLVAERDDGKTVTRHWRTAEPMAGYVAHVSVGHFDAAESSTDDGLPVYVAVDPAEPAEAGDVAALVAEIVGWGGERFGPYPFSSTGAVVDHLPELDYALETQTRPYFGEAPDEALLVHELAHQWFGNSVTPRRWKDMWLSEGLATYAEWLWEEDQGAEAPARSSTTSTTARTPRARASGPSPGRPAQRGPRLRSARLRPRRHGRAQGARGRRRRDVLRHPAHLDPPAPARQRRHPAVRRPVRGDVREGPDRPLRRMALRREETVPDVRRAVRRESAGPPRPAPPRSGPVRSTGVGGPYSNGATSAPNAAIWSVSSVRVRQRKRIWIWSTPIAG